MCHFTPPTMPRTWVRQAVSNGLPRAQCRLMIGFARVIKAAAGEVQAGVDVLRFQIGKLGYHLFGRKAAGKEIEDVGHPDTHATYTRTAAALLRIGGDALVQDCHFVLHPGRWVL
jgi:hypothetical protein